MNNENITEIKSYIDIELKRIVDYLLKLEGVLFFNKISSYDLEMKIGSIKKDLSDIRWKVIK